MSPEDVAFWTELRRHLVGIVGLIERHAGIEPSPPRWCAGCPNCERLNRQQRDARYTMQVRAQAPREAPRN